MNVDENDDESKEDPIIYTLGQNNGLPEPQRPMYQLHINSKLMKQLELAAWGYARDIVPNAPDVICQLIVEWTKDLADILQMARTAIDRLKDKMRENLYKRINAIEEAVNNARHKISFISIINRPSPFKVSPIVVKTALERMVSKIELWSGVDISGCNQPLKSFKLYMRIADNWCASYYALIVSECKCFDIPNLRWNRQIGKWFGDVLFLHIAH